MRMEQCREAVVGMEGGKLLVDAAHASWPKPMLRRLENVEPRRAASNASGLGDMVASGLAAVGITKERAQAVASAVGVKDCGCAKRQAALNKLGEKLGLPPGQS